MKIVSWNVRGLGSKKKRCVIKDLLVKIYPDVVIFQETKLEPVDRNVLKSLWEARNKGWSSLQSCGRSGGILIMWDERIVSVLEMVCGVFSISIKVKGLNEFVCWLSGVYGPKKPMDRREFWEELYLGCVIQIGSWEVILMLLDI